MARPSSPSPKITLTLDDDTPSAFVQRVMSAAIRRVTEARNFDVSAQSAIPVGNPLNYVKLQQQHHPHSPPQPQPHETDNPLAIPDPAVSRPPPLPPTGEPGVHRLSFQVFVDEDDNVGTLTPRRANALSTSHGAKRQSSSLAGSGSDHQLLSHTGRPPIAPMSSIPQTGLAGGVQEEWRLPWGDGPIPAISTVRRESESSGTRSSTSHQDLVLPTAKQLPAVSYLSPQLDDSTNIQRSLRQLSVASNSSIRSEASMRGLHVPALFSTPGSLIATPCFRHSGAAPVAHVIPGTLFVGSFRAFCDVDTCQSLGIKAYLCVAEEVKPGLPPHVNMNDIRDGKIGFMKLNLLDNASTVLRDHIDAAFNFVDDHVNRGHPVALYCQAGKSRSVSLALAFMMREYDMTALEALASLQSQYVEAEPNIFFLQQLEALDGQLHRDATLAVDLVDEDDPAADLDFTQHDSRTHLHGGPGASPKSRSPALVDLVSYSPTVEDLPMPLNDGRKKRRKKKTTAPGSTSRGRSERVKGDTAEVSADESESADSRSASPSADGSLPNSPTSFKRSYAGSPKGLGGSLTTLVPSRPTSAAVAAAPQRHATSKSPYSSPDYSPLPMVARRRRVLDV